MIAAFERPGSAELGLGEIADRAGLPLSTTHRLVGELAEWGGFERTDSGRYRLGMRLWRLGVRAPAPQRLREAARPYLNDLVELTRQNVHLAVREGLTALYLERLSARGAVPIVSQVGGRLPLHATGVGLVLLAHAPIEVYDELIAAGPRKYLPNTQTTDAELRPRLAEVRTLGLAVSVEEMTELTYSAAAPLRDATGTVVAAVSIIAHPEERHKPEHATAVRVAARGISRALGWRG